MLCKVRSSYKLGNIKEIGPISQREYLITMLGTEMLLEDAEILVEKLYPVFCPVQQTFIMEKSIFYLEGGL